jgi:addiction module RelE/StbE family toxin
MKTEVIYLPKAVSDQADIKNYLSQFYPGTNKRFFSLLKKKIARLKTYPYSCPVYEDDPDYRKLVVGEYLVFYTVDENTKIVKIHRLLHGSRDISQHMYN